MNTFESDDISLSSNLLQNNLNSIQNNSFMIQGIMSYATEKLNVREGDPLFLIPRIRDNLKLKPALVKREPEWWMGSELTLAG
mmetsp:Transcript_14824/g.14408  ORF Transcript_14824/g.14408 Transcript_14824/m.14408 type:complete len:83 (+) Transcript_14824:569-817(+)|eukprot:CAMPEP_0170554308 /NCGR_PEP_ID=MMETSP0211-20121228/12159_1 /TAXON_ID=311385 /ORGANISM="Pseudokeronopsis sp., Strain OXSARD2" /LENGTH=82 /DNA_ID=CAMNT_0010863259 /DNA_START=1420 /DNA_END=1668 /DNA_ORIENTATION=-